MVDIVVCIAPPVQPIRVRGENSLRDGADGNCPRDNFNLENSGGLVD